MNGQRIGGHKRASSAGKGTFRTELQPTAGIHYVVAFIFPWIFGITVGIMRHQTYGDISASARLSDAMTALDIVNAIIWPLKGFFTFLAYMRPARGKRRAQHPASTAGTSSDAGENSAEMRGIWRFLPRVHFQRNSWPVSSSVTAASGANGPTASAPIAVLERTTAPASGSLTTPGIGGQTASAQLTVLENSSGQELGE